MGLPYMGNRTSQAWQGEGRLTGSHIEGRLAGMAVQGMDLSLLPHWIHPPWNCLDPARVCGIQVEQREEFGL